MKAVLIPIQPYWVFLIIAKKMRWDVPQEKTIEVRKSFPRDVNWNRKSLIYCSSNKQSFNRIPQKYQPFMAELLGKVIGEFVCDKLIWVLAHPNIFAGHPLFYSQAINDACLTEDEVEKYSGGKDVYGWHISDLVIYDKPRELGEFHKPTLPTGLRYEDDAITRPPQSWCYVEE